MLFCCAEAPEAFNSNRAIAGLLECLPGARAPEGAVQLIETTDREAVNVMIRMNQYLMCYSRGGAGLIRTVVENATVPVIETGRKLSYLCGRYRFGQSGAYCSQCQVPEAGSL